LLGKAQGRPCTSYVRWRSLGDSKPCFRRERVNTQRTANVRERKEAPIPSIFLAIFVRCDTLTFAYRYFPKSSHLLGEKNGAYGPRCEARLSGRSAAASHPTRTILAHRGKGAGARLPAPDKWRYVACPQVDRGGLYRA